MDREIAKQIAEEIIEKTAHYIGQSVVDIKPDGTYYVEATGNHRHENYYIHVKPLGARLSGLEEEDMEDYDYFRDCEKSEMIDLIVGFLTEEEEAE